MQVMKAMSRDEEVCARITRTQLHVDILSNLRYNSLSTQSLSQSRSQSVEIVQKQLSVLHNVVARSATSRTAFNRSLDILHKLCQLSIPVSVSH